MHRLSSHWQWIWFPDQHQMWVDLSVLFFCFVLLCFEGISASSPHCCFFCLSSCVRVSVCLYVHIAISVCLCSCPAFVAHLSTIIPSSPYAFAIQPDSLLFLYKVNLRFVFQVIIFVHFLFLVCKAECLLEALLKILFPHIRWAVLGSQAFSSKHRKVGLIKNNLSRSNCPWRKSEVQGLDDRTLSLWWR